MEDLFALQAARSQERLQAVKEGLEEFVRFNQAKSEIVIKAVTEPRPRLDVKA